MNQFNLRSTALLISLALASAAAQAAPPEEKTKEPIVHATYYGVFDIGSNETAFIVGPIKPEESMTIPTLTSTNPNTNPIRIIYRAFQPVTEPKNRDGCVAPASVVEASRPKTSRHSLVSAAVGCVFLKNCSESR